MQKIIVEKLQLAQEALEKLLNADEHLTVVDRIEVENIITDIKKIKADMLSELEWEKAIKHAREALEIYKTIPAGTFAAINISTLIIRYENGERSEHLLNALENIKL